MSSIEKVIADIFDYDSGNMQNINFSEEISQQLYDFQIRHLINLISLCEKENVIVDASETKTGKTYTTIALCKQLKFKPFIVCQKIMMTHWKNICHLFDLNYYGIVDYKTIQDGYWYERGERVKCKFIKISDNGCGVEYEWTLPHNAVIIFDDPLMNYFDPYSRREKLLLATKPKHKNSFRVLLLGNHIIQNTKQFQVFGYLLGFYRFLNAGDSWIRKIIRENKLELNNMSPLYNKIIHQKGEMMKNNPHNKIFIQCYDNKKNSANIINNNLSQINYYISQNNIIESEITKLTFGIELAKVYIVKNLCNILLNQRIKIIIYVNFDRTVKILSDFFGNCITICRKGNIKDLLKLEKYDVVICNMDATTNTQNLEKIELNFPIATIIFPPTSSARLTKTIEYTEKVYNPIYIKQNIIYCHHTVENKICERINKKFNQSLKISDYDLTNIN
jgi:hypothetical protein